MYVVGLDSRIEGRSHEAAVARFIEPNVLVARECRAKIDLRYCIQPPCLQEGTRAPIAGFHHQFDERTNIRRRVVSRRRTCQTAPRMCAHEIIDNVESQVRTGQRLRVQIHERPKMDD